MKQIFIAALLLLMSIHSAMAFSAVDAFTSAPDVVLPLLPKNTRLDMIDYFNSGTSIASKNKLDGEARILSLTDKVLRFTMSEVSEYQVVVLKYGKEEIIALIETLKTPIADSRISFYNSRWEPIEKSCFKEPELKTWLTKVGSKKIDDVRAALPFMLVQYEYNSEDNTLTLTSNAEQFLSREAYSGISQWLKPSLKYAWIGKKFTLVKE